MILSLRRPKFEWGSRAETHGSRGGATQSRRFKVWRKYKVWFGFGFFKGMRKQHEALEAIDELAKKDIATTVAAWSPGIYRQYILNEPRPLFHVLSG